MDVVVLCIGSEKIMGDSLGPLVGDILKNRYNVKAFVYGDLLTSVNGKTVNEYMAFLNHVHPHSVFVCIDACLGHEKNMAKIAVNAGGIRPAQAVSKQSVPFGDIGILGVVGRRGHDALTELLSASPVLVDELANKVALLVNYALAS